LLGRAGLAVVLVVGVSGCQGEPASPPDSAVPSASESPSPEPSEPPRVSVPAGVRAGYVVFDRERGAVVLRAGERRTFRSASVVKILIALDHLRTRGVSGADLGSLRPMLRVSDDGAATRLWRAGGQGQIIERMVPLVGLGQTAPPPAERPGFWGYTALSALDVAKTYRYVLEKAPAEHRKLIMGELRKAPKCGLDRYDQYFGIPRALPRPWAIKQGWSGFGDVPATPCEGTSGVRYASAPDLGLGRPVLHTTGVVGERDEKIVVVLTLHPAGSSFRTASARLTALTKRVYRAAE
jgi:hypothetical protein